MTIGNRGGDTVFFGAAWSKLRSPLPVPAGHGLPWEGKSLGVWLGFACGSFIQPFDRLKGRGWKTVDEPVEPQSLSSEK